MDTTTNNGRFNRPKAFKILFAILIGIFLLGLLYWLIFSRNSESTDDAYVSGSQIQVVSQIEGAIATVNVSETQSVEEGQTLFRIDPTEVMIASEKADIDLRNAEADYQKRKALQGDASVSKEELEHSHLALLKAMANARQAYINLLRVDVQSPAKATIAKRYAQVGQRVAPGTQLAMMVAGDHIWVDANFKEDQLKNIRIGQSVKLESDIYGGKMEFHGKVVGFAPGTGSTLALLPPQNATGNWVKVVQRLPVRIALDSNELNKYPLNIGLSMNVKVDTSNRDGSSLQAMDKGPISDTTIYQKQFDKAERHIQSLLTKSKKP
ncbi:efflux RND transporter periplasmic adaptor subunit [Polynucleobacter sp. AP-Kaivos-20-H2]|uniref:HlyD family secretion protein n=1 Tax=Polynucleobacter sp. AP-Kaivos-20-H2 TaxID=2689104 RepID=UPI001C0C7A80|nr:efflux RND transporter periplasmic adaptor subunit [Polynucleobacter sp. AP-Kaivos-20-H2]MBU3603109.1 efflux RND transporter periplasmic adaptor subunit [Polynucleobacter sp. AP-Kaivos-20-H2]